VYHLGVMLSEYMESDRWAAECFISYNSQITCYSCYNKHMTCQQQLEGMKVHCGLRSKILLVTPAASVHM
jgi:hypothetical protein